MHAHSDVSFDVKDEYIMIIANCNGASWLANSVDEKKNNMKFEDSPIDINGQQENL